MTELTESTDSKSSKKRNRNSNDDDTIVEENYIIDNFELLFPKHAECILATSIFELGLLNSSPKLIMPLMPYIANLNTEHVKSHLQKYRIHRQRSKDDFIEYFESQIKQSFNEWDTSKEWNKIVNNNNNNNNHNNHHHNINPNTSSSSNDSNISNNTDNYSDIELKEGTTTQLDTTTTNNNIIHKQCVLGLNHNQSTSSQSLSIGLDVMKDSENILKDWQILCKDMIISSDKLKCDLVKCNDLLKINNDDNNSNIDNT